MTGKRNAGWRSSFSSFPFHWRPPLHDRRRLCRRTTQRFLEDCTKETDGIQILGSKEAGRWPGPMTAMPPRRTRHSRTRRTDARKAHKAMDFIAKKFLVASDASSSGLLHDGNARKLNDGDHRLGKQHGGRRGQVRRAHTRPSQ